MDKTPSTYYTPTQPSSKVKKAIVKTLADNSIEQFKKIMEIFELPPDLDVSTDQSQNQILQYTCKYNRKEATKYVLDQVFKQEDDKYISFVNTQNAQNLTAFMTCSIYGSHDCATLLTEYGGVSINLVGTDGKSAYEYAKSRGDAGMMNLIEDIIKKMKKSHSEACILPLNEELKLEMLKDINLDEVPEKRELSPNSKEELYRLGTKIGCRECDKNTGLIMYSKCCGEPLHQACVAKATTCPVCKQAVLRLSYDVIIPEKAFIIG